MFLPLGDLVLGIPVDQINALSQIGFAGGSVIVIVLLVTGKLTAGYLLDRAEARATKLQSALDAAAVVNASFPRVISDLIAAHEREVNGLTAEMRHLQDMIVPHR